MKTQELISERSDQNAVKIRSLGPAAVVPSWHSWCWLAAAVFSLLFADGGNTIALAAWVAPACLLRVARTQPLWRGASLVYVAFVVMRAITYRGMIPIPGIFYYLFLAVAALFATTPYLVDRVLSRKLGSGLGTLVFPSTLVVVQFATSYGAHGSWGSVAYTQAGNLPLLQSLSVFGLWGIAFLIGWFASAVNQLLEQGLRSRIALKTAVLFAGVYGVIILTGGVRLTLFPPDSEAVRTASLSPLKNDLSIPESLLDGVLQGSASDAQVRQFNSLAAAGQQELLSRTDRDAHAGAKIVFWSEGAATVLKQSEAALLAKAQTMARNDRIYLGLSMAVWTAQQQHPLESKITLIDPSGETAFEFLKARPTPGPEMAAAQASDVLLPLTITSFGRMSAAICYDMDFPRLMAQEGRQRVDILLSPASDWAGIDPRHTQMAQFRAIEQGFNLLRQANLGLSAAYEYEGRTLATMDDRHSEDLTLVAQIPTRGVHTVYARFGDWFAWTCALAIVVLALSAFEVCERSRNWRGEQILKERKMNLPKIVTRDEWLEARKELLAREKDFDRERDRLTEARRKLPMVKVEKEYIFDGPQGAVPLRDLFEGRRQLIVYHMMFDPAGTTACKHCSCVMDNIAGGLIHLTARDTSFATISRAPIAKIEAFKRRMQWAFPWVSSFKNDFNYDYHVTLDPDRGSTVYNYRTLDYRGELPGLSVFFRDNDLIFHSYSTYFRGLDILLPMYHLLDRTPLGRQEDKGNSMHAGENSWIRYHDAYGVEGNSACCSD